MNSTQHESHFFDEAGRPSGGTSTGIGYTIAWQRGPAPIGADGTQPDRNGAFIIEVLEACQARLEFYQMGDFACEENERALRWLGECLNALRTRRERRKDAGTLGTHEKD